MAKVYQKLIYFELGKVVVCMSLPMVQVDYHTVLKCLVYFSIINGGLIFTFS